MSAGPLLPGDPAAVGGYRLEGRLGEGGQGTVFLGRTASGQAVAVKLLHPALLGDPTARTRFVRELAAVRRVARFCTAQIVAADTDGERPYIVSEFVDGPSLAVEVARSGPRRGAELDRLAVGTATALAAIHEAGVVHCDFKPANVILGPDGPRVIDFGIARALDVSGTASQVIGTPAYMAPEQITRSEIRPPADVFAWGATIAFAVNGTSPFAADSSPATMYRVLEQPPVLGRLDGPLREVVARCLDKDPAARPSSRELLLTLVTSPGSRDPRPDDLLDVGANRAHVPTPRTAAALPPTLVGEEPTVALPGRDAAVAPTVVPVAPTVVPVAPPGARRRGTLIASVVAAVVVAAAAVVWFTLLRGPGSADSIPQAFAGDWTGSGRLTAEGTTVTPELQFVTGARHSEVSVGESACGTGTLDFRSATSDHMEMEFDAPDGCPSGTMAFDLTADGTLAMSLGDRSTTTYYATLHR